MELRSRVRYGAVWFVVFGFFVCGLHFVFPFVFEKMQVANVRQIDSREVPVVRVVDGDTIVVLLSGEEEKVRLLGINTPETVDPRKPVECFGKEAGDETKTLLSPGTGVTLVSDPSQSDRDKYGRLLRYVYRSDGLFINEYLVKEGYAYEYTYDVPYKFQSQFKSDETHARTAFLGLWAPGACDH